MRCVDRRGGYVVSNPSLGSLLSLRHRELQNRAKNLLTVQDKRLFANVIHQASFGDETLTGRIKGATDIVLSNL
jgi:hypothetical protein